MNAAPALNGVEWWRALVRHATTETDMERVYRLRYRVYVGEHGKPYPRADHAGGRLTDGLDGHSCVLLAERGDVVIGTVRGTAACAPGFIDEYGPLFGLERSVRATLGRVGYASRLVVDAEHRGRSRVAVALMTAIFDWACTQQFALCLCHTTHRLVPLMERLGWSCQGRPFVHADSGSIQVPMVLHTWELERLRALNSPFWAVGARHAAVAGPGRAESSSGTLAPVAASSR